MKMQVKDQRRKVLFKGIGKAAEALHCSRRHLWAVLVGQRKSKSLTARYAALLAAQAALAPTEPA